MSANINIEDYAGGIEMGPAIVASVLAPQLGSDRSEVMHGRVDMRRLTVIKESDVPFLIFAKLRSRKSRPWEIVREELLNLKVSVGGRGRRDIIRMEGVSKGGMVSVESEITQPGWLRRNLYDRNWERNQREARGE